MEKQQTETSLQTSRKWPYFGRLDDCLSANTVHGQAIHVHCNFKTPVIHTYGFIMESSGISNMFFKRTSKEIAR